MSVTSHYNYDYYSINDCSEIGCRVLHNRMSDLDPKTDQSKRDVIRDIKARILAHEFLKLNIVIAL